MALQAAAKLASEIGRDFSPGTINSQSTRASAPGTCLLRVAAGTPAFSPARFANCHNRTSPAPIMGPLGTPMGSPWDLDGTSVRRTLLEMGLYAKSPIRECVPAGASIAGTHPSHKSQSLLYLPATHSESSTYRRVLLLSEAIIQLTTPTPPGGEGGSERLRHSADRARSTSAARFLRRRKRP